jgi:hypothetical protein
MNDRPSLIWSPTYKYVVDRIYHHKQLRLLIAPFVKLDALKTLLEACEDTSDLSIIVRWRGSDLVSGVSDTSIYPYLKERRVPLYIHQSIHLKLMIFDDSLAFHTSGNITQRGLGLYPQHNIEIGCQVEINHSDWRHIYEILNQSRRVDDDVYNAVCKYRDENLSKSPPIPQMNLPADIEKQFSMLSLPSSESPEELFHSYQSPGCEDSDIAAFVHDLILFDLPTGLERVAFFQFLETRFREHPFIQAIVEFIRGAGTARFGLVNKWITDNCSDRPTPYRWELKSITRRLYDWLDYFYQEISWDVPGAHSMVIRWTDVEPGDHDVGS